MMAIETASQVEYNFKCAHVLAMLAEIHAQQDRNISAFEMAEFVLKILAVLKAPKIVPKNYVSNWKRNSRRNKLRRRISESLASLYRFLCRKSNLIILHKLLNETGIAKSNSCSF